MSLCSPHASHIRESPGPEGESQAFSCIDVEGFASEPRYMLVCDVCEECIAPQLLKVGAIKEKCSNLLQRWHWFDICTSHSR